MRVTVSKWNSLCWGLVLLIWNTSGALAAEKKPSEIKAAVVNGTVITQAEVDRGVEGIQKRVMRTGQVISPDKVQEVRKKVLDDLIDQELLFQASRSKGIKAEKGVIDEEMAALKKQFQNEEAFRAAIKDADLSEKALRTYMEKGISVQRFVAREFADKIDVLPEEMKAYYEGNPHLFKQPERVRASHILIKIDAASDAGKKGEVKKKMETLRERLKKGEDFAALAKEASQDSSSANGGDLGFFTRGKMVKPFEDAAFGLNPGEVSNIVESQFGLHLIKVTDKKPESVMVYEEVKKGLEQYLKDMKIKEGVDKLVAKLKEKAKLEKFPPEKGK